MNKKVFSIILIFSLALNLAVVGTYIFRKLNPPPERFFPHDPGRASFFNEMQLDKDQRDKMFKLMHEFRDANRKRMEMIFQLQDELFHTIRSGDADSAKIDSLVNKIGKLRIEQSKKAINHFKKFRKLLTPMQQDHFYRMLMENRPERHRMRFDRRRESGPRRNNYGPGFRSDSSSNAN